MKDLLKRNSGALIKVQIFTLRDLWLFLVSIIFVSATSGAIGAFMLGVNNEEFFIGEADNIVIITAPGITTPFTGRVPEYLQNDIQKISGVLAISPETIALTVSQNLNDKSIVVRGITGSFTQLNPTEIIKGSWFDPSYGQANETQINGAVIGHILADDLGLSSGDKIQLACTLTDAVVEVAITGIIKSNSPCDEEILVSLAVGKTIAGKESSYVSILRVLIDDEIISKQALYEILNREYSVPVLLRSRDPELAANIIGTPITVYTPYGDLVETQTIGNDNKTEFQLPFGTYEIVATPAGAPNSPVTNIFVNQSFDTPFEITIGLFSYDLELNITHNNHPSYNATVFLQKKFQPEVEYSSRTDSEGFVHFYNVPEDFYQISIFYEKLERHLTINLNESMHLDVEIESSLSLIILDYSSGQEVQGGSVRVLNVYTLIEVYYDSSYQSTTKIFLNSSRYRVEFQYNGILRSFITEVNRSVSRILYVGTASLDILVRDNDEQGLESANVSITYYNGTTLQAFTDNNGLCEFQLDVGLYYEIIAIPQGAPSKVYNRSIYFSNSSSLNIDIIDSYRLNILTINGTIENTPNNTLSGCDITILKGKITVVSDKTNSLGQLSVGFSEPGVYTIIAEKDGFFWNRNISVYSKNVSSLIKLGNVRLVVSTESITGYPIPGVLISVAKGDIFFDSDITNSSGLLELFFPIGTDYTIRVVKLGYYSEENITVLESQSFSMTKTIELNGDLTIHLSNQYYQKITDAFIVLTHEYYDLEYMGYTNNKGELTFYKIPWGNYSLQASYIEERFPKKPINFTGEDATLEIKIEMLNILAFSNGDIQWRRHSSFSVILSSDYVSSFLRSTLDVFMTTFTSLVIIISVLSLLSIASVISNPIVSNEKTLRTFQQLGASRSQVILGVVIHIGIVGILASLVGSIIGMWIMTSLPTLQNMNIGGVIIQPTLNLWLSVIITFSNLVVIVFKAIQKSHEIYTK
ncbi:MAG: ABC transporter permease [Candidatus Hodarchaeota archaeon]